MNIFRISWKYISARPLNTLLNVFLFGLGVSIIVSLMLFAHQLENKLEKNISGIDLVVGAKGSPLQLILCNIFHLDFPTGNIPLAEAEKLAGTRFVKEAIPLALGDSHRGFRIVGTNKKYPALYGATLAQGVWWTKEMEVVVGANVARQMGWAPGDTFEGQHGLDAAGGHHEDQPYRVVGVMDPTGTAPDNLILTSVPGVWAVHGEGERTDSIVAEKPSRLIPGILLAENESREITSLLIQYRNPMAVIQLPRIVNTQTPMQAASPAFETARLFSLLGSGLKVAHGLAYVIVFVAALSVFIALYNSMKDRRYDLAIMRAMGASRIKLFNSVVLEGMIISILGGTLGVLMGHGILEVIGLQLEEARKSGITGLFWINAELWIAAGALAIGGLSALIPALHVMRVDISKVLAE
ncbi:MAG: ABC transporter permease [Cyclobacteriaceae bacterium]|nr:ABC transporter permease [Cyclobacteriaceae bacterium]